MRSASPIAWAAAGSSAPARSRTRTGSTSAPSSPKCATPIAAQRVKTSSPSGYEAVGRIATRGRDAPGRGQQAGIELGHRGEELAGADERHGSGHGGESTRTLPDDRARTQLRSSLARHDHPPALDPHLHGHRVRRRLPRRHDRQRRRSSTSARSCPARSSASSRARPTSSAATWRCWPRCSSWPARCPTTTAGAASTRSASIGFAATSALCGLAPTLEWLVVFRLVQGAAGALLIPGSLALITHAFDGAARGRAFGIWAASTSALTVARPDRRRRRSSTRSAGGSRSSINVPLLGVRAVGDADATSRSRATPRSTGRFDWLGALVAALAVGGLAFGVIRGQANEWADTAAWIAIGDRRRGARRLPDPDGPPTEPARPARAVPVAGVRDDQPRRRSSSTARLYVTFFYQAVVLQGVLGYTALGAGSIGTPVRASCWPSSRPGSGRWPGGSARAGSWSRGRC